MSFGTRRVSQLFVLQLMLCIAVACGGSEDGSNPTATSTSGGGDTAVGGAAAGGNAAGGDGQGGGIEGGGGGGAGGTASCRYPGIPHPTDMLPGGTMPDLPAPSSVSGFPYDPCTLATPTPSGDANEWIVSVSGDDATAGANGQGSEAAPRRTIPFGTFTAGTRIFILGASTPYGTVDFNIGEDEESSFTCTAENACWMIGVDQPRIGRRFDIRNSTHLLIDGLSMVDLPGQREWGAINFRDSSFITLRNSEIRGNGVNSRGGSAISMDGVNMMVTVGVSIHDVGSWDSNQSGLDVHGWRPLYRNRHLWLLDSEIYRLQADGVQVGNSSNPNPQGDTSHYIYIGGNTFSENYENALDNKNGYHVVFSSNDVHDFYAANGASGANGTAIILSNNAEGPWTSYHWALNNRIWNTSLAIRDSGSEPGERNFAVGNLIFDADTAFIYADNADNRESWFIHNTVTSTGLLGLEVQLEANASFFVRHNVFDRAGVIASLPALNSVLTNNVLFMIQVAGQWDSETKNITGDPLLTNPANGELDLATGSPAIDATPTEDPVFALFETLYGLDIRVDREGQTRPNGGGWDLGALESP